VSRKQTSAHTQSGGRAANSDALCAWDTAFGFMPQLDGRQSQFYPAKKICLTRMVLAKNSIGSLGVAPRLNRQLIAVGLIS